jgi:hypothetical protein
LRHSATSPPARSVALVEHLVLTAVALVPQLCARPGSVTADTKTYLYVDPGRYLRQSLSMWDPTVGLGTVTHQQIGYLFPMGPFFWATHEVGVPTWVAQRLWVASLLFAAGTGVWWLLRRCSVQGPGRIVASLAYLASPYPLQYLGHISVILVAFAALPWVVLLVDKAAASPSWRPIAALALAVAAMGSVNATSALYVGVGPVLWLAWGAATRHFGWASAWRVAWRTALLGGLVSLWWVAGLAVEGGYGLDVLRYTETVQAVSTTSLSSEVVRGLGYWYFYGGDNFGPWVSAMPQFTQQLWLLGIGYGVPVLAVAAAVGTRWRHRSVFVVMALLGTVLAVGAHPITGPSPAGRLLRAVLSSGTVGLALRSTDRATPLVVLALAALLGSGVTAWWRRAPVPGLALGALSAGVVVLSNPALWNGTSVPATFVEAPVASYQQHAAAALDRAGGGPVLGVPGQPFASTFAGTTVDPLWPGLLSRPFVTREQQVMGSLATEDLLYGFDDPVQTGTADPAALAPMARLMGAGDLLLQNDLAFTRYGQPDPAVLWSQLADGGPGLGRPRQFGPRRPAQNRSKVVDEQTYTLAPGVPAVPSLAVLPVDGPRPLVRAEGSARPMIVDGDGTGLGDLAGTGLLAGDPTVLYAGTLDTRRAARRASLGAGATLVVTDSNRRRPFRWDNLQNVAGPTLGAGQPQPADPANHPLDIFPGAPSDAQTTTLVTGVASVSASVSANPFQNLPEDRPVEAIDGNPGTAWQVGPFLDPRGQWWQVRLQSPARAGEVTLVQPQTGRHNQWITAVTLRFDGRAPVHARLGEASRRPGGQRIAFPARTFRTLRVTIDDTSVPRARALTGGLSPVGLAEVELAPPVQAEEQVVMPSDLLRTAGASEREDRVAFVMTRQRVAPALSRADPEAALDRRFSLPSSRTFALTGTARIDTGAPDDTVDRLTGRPGADGTGVTASSSGRLQGDVADTASAALDGDPATVWSSPLGPGEQAGQAITVRLPDPITFDHLDLQVVVDGRHSVPDRLSVATEQGDVAVEVPKLPRRDAPGASVPVTVRFPPLTGRVVTVSVLGIRPLRATDSYTGGRDTLPVALAELGIPGARMAKAPAVMPATCRGDLLQIDGTPVWLEVSGTTAAALSGAGSPVALCGPDSGGLALGPGTHHLVATLGGTSGLDLDQLVLDSAPGGGPEAGDRPGALIPAVPAPAAPPPGGPPPAAGSVPTAQVVRRHATSFDVRLSFPSSEATSSGSGMAPVWLVLGESINSGWQASVAGRSLGPPTLVDGFANGWLVPRAALRPGATLHVALRWAPQRAVDVALVISAAAGALCLAIVLWPRRRRAAPSAGHDGPAVIEVAPSGDDNEPALDVAGALAPGTPGRPWGPAVAVAVATAVIGAVTAGPLVGGALGVTVLGVARARRGRAVVGMLAVSAMIGTAVAMVVIEAVGSYPGDGRWASHFEAAALLTWLALVLVAAEGLVRRARRTRRRRGGDDARRRGSRASPPRSPPS